MRNLNGFLVLVVMILSTGCLMTRDQIREGTSRSGEQSQISQTQIKKAEQVARMDDLEEMVRATRGRIEVVENDVNLMKQSQQEAGASSEEAAKMDTRFQLFEEALKSLEAQVQTLAGEIQSMKSAGGGSTTSKKKKGNFAGAQEAFSSKNWKKAIVGYQKYRDLYDIGRWYAEATYKIGVSFQELNMKSEAKAFFEEVIAKYPKGKNAKKAKYRLKNLK